MTDLQDKSIQLWRDAHFELHWKLRAAEAHIEKLETEVLEWQKVGSAATQAMSDAADDCVRATKLAAEKHRQVEAYRDLCNKQAQTMAEMSAQIDELAEIAGIKVKPTRQ